MWKTLGCLVVAMTGTSALLGWMDPSPENSAQVVTDFEIVSLARESVESGFSADIDVGQWHEVEIAPVVRRPIADSLLAARRSPLDYHFYVDRSGRPLKTVHWRRQQALTGRPGIIRIEVESPGPGEPNSQAQQFCVAQLVDTLAGFLHIERDSLAVHWPDVWEPQSASHTPVAAVP